MKNCIILILALLVTTVIARAARRIYIVPPAPKIVTRPIISKGIHWSVNNTDSSFGKSLTGWSTTKFDSEFKPMHIKIGIISGRMGMLNEIKREEYRKLGILEDWHRTPTSTVFGIHFIKEF